MKRHLKILGMFFGLSLLWAAQSYGETPGGEKYMGLYDDNRFKEVDANNDGVLDKNELKANQKWFEHYKDISRFKHADKNGDGVISLDEAKAERQWEIQKRARIAKEGKDRIEDVRDRREDRRDRAEDIRDKREDRWDATHNPPPGTEAYRRDKLEDVRDRKEDIRDRREDVRDRREDRRDRREDFRDRREDRRDNTNMQRMPHPQAKPMPHNKR